MGAAADRSQVLGDFLRSRREALSPEEVGMEVGPRRRTRGLRREEVAMLAAISPTYLAFLEQGREVRPSAQVLEALSAALRLDRAERTHLFGLAEVAAPGTSSGPPEILPSGVADLLDSLEPDPAYATGRRFDILAANRVARALWTDWVALAPEERNIVWWTFTAPAARSVLVEWEKEATALLGRYRIAADRHPDDPAFAELTTRLCEASPEFRDWWPRHDVSPLGSGVKKLRHPRLGEIEMPHLVLQLADDPGIKLVSFRLSPDLREQIVTELAPGLGDASTRLA